MRTPQQMNNARVMKRSKHLRSSLLALVTTAALPLLLTGCGVGSSTGGSPATISVPHLTGRAFGGQQPVSGATIQLYAVGTTGYGSAATALLTGAPVKSGADGSFGITGAYTCPSSAEVYITATGGNPGGGTNSSLAMMAALGLCSGLTSSTFISINELTTVGSVWALSSFMSGLNVGAPPSNTAGLADAFADVNQLVNTSTGTVPGSALPAGAVVPIAQVNTIADVLSACVNSSDAGGASTQCSMLFASSKSMAGVAPTDTITSALNIARNPAANVSSLLALSPSSAPFQPQLPSPNDYTLSITYAAGVNPAAMAVDAHDNLWIVNQGANSVMQLTPSGAASTYTSGSLNHPSAIAIDAGGYVWIANAGNNTLTKLSSTGANIAGSPFSGGGLNSPSSVAIDPFGNVWVSNKGANTVSEFSGASLSVVSYGYTAIGNSGLLGIGIDPR